MMEWVLQGVVRATLLWGGAFVVWRWLPSGWPGVRRGAILAISALVLAAPWWAGWWLVGPWRGLGGPAAVNEGVWRWLMVLAGGMWLVGTVVCWVRWGRQVIRLKRLVRRSRPLPPPFGLAGAERVPVRLSEEISGPCVAGFWRPVLLVPPQSRDWSASHWRMVLDHEAQHIRQGDLLAGWLPRLVLAAYWWHPLAHWMARQFHLESEALCDRAVVAGRRNVREYVEFLLALDGGRLPRLAAPMARLQRLSHRIERLLEPPGRKAGLASLTAALGLLATVVAVALSVGARPRPTGAPVPVDDRSADTLLRLSASPFPADGE